MNMNGAIHKVSAQPGGGRGQAKEYEKVQGRGGLEKKYIRFCACFVFIFLTLLILKNSTEIALIRF